MNNLFLLVPTYPAMSVSLPQTACKKFKMEKLCRMAMSFPDGSHRGFEHIILTREQNWCFCFIPISNLGARSTAADPLSEECKFPVLRVIGKDDDYGACLMGTDLGVLFLGRNFWRAIAHFVRTKPKNQLPNQWFQCKQMQTDAVSITCDCPCRVRKERALLLMSNTLVVPLRVRPILWLWTKSLAMVVQPFSLIWTHLI